MCATHNWISSMLAHLPKYLQLNKKRTEGQQESVLVLLITIVKLEIQNLQFCRDGAHQIIAVNIIVSTQASLARNKST